MPSQKNHFWSSPIAEPKRAYRWVMNINDIPQWIIKGVNKPGYSVSTSQHQYINHTFYYPGRVSYDPVSVTLVDPVAPDASAKMMQILQQSGYSFPEDQNDTNTISKARAVLALGNVSIKQLGPEGGNPIEEILLKNAWVSNVNLGDLSYDVDDMVNISVQITYDYFTLKSAPPQENQFGRVLDSVARA